MIKDCDLYKIDDTNTNVFSILTELLLLVVTEKNNLASW